MLNGNRRVRWTSLSLFAAIILGSAACGGETPDQGSNSSLPDADKAIEAASAPGAIEQPRATDDSRTTMESGAVTASPESIPPSSDGSAGTESVSVSNGQQTVASTGTAVQQSSDARAVETGGNETASAYDPTVWDRLLKANVTNGRANYAGFKASAEFAEFLEALRSASPDGMSPNGKLAFWINAYNALVIENVNNNPGIKRPLDVPGFFDKKIFSVAGRTLTLNQIENEIVRPTFKEPLIHFGLVCAALSCPPLINKAYTGSNVRSQLAANARAYLADSKQNRFDAASATLSLSKIFEWYKEDFGGNDAGLVAFAKKYGPAEMREGLDGAESPAVNFLEYDWTLNRK